ncbi:NYN domain-containing protein [Rathayibacter sp. AY1F9]|uniref:NYN domain-containing protein n=1 Tax=Rathayibacter sp. AY1F9 TaxID=2080563 RepID=UPI000CE8FBFF|nr:NYN domain-containing protein [Rathayibacter sp. AY1F9]PPH30322.1 NYN domain-containing protein [Rathayibacter sp. AY1F9]
MYTPEAAQKRRLVLIDIENIVGGGVSRSSQLQVAQEAIRETIGQRPDDLVVLGCGRFSVDIVGFEWQGPRRLVFRPGRDGADLELLEVLETERVEERFEQVVLVSGDGIFTDAVSRLGAGNVDVTVVSRPDACSRALRMAAAHMLDLIYDHDAFQEAA